MKKIWAIIPLTLLCVALVWIVALRAEIANAEPWAMAPPDVDMGGIVTAEKCIDLAAEEMTDTSSTASDPPSPQEEGIDGTGKPVPYSGADGGRTMTAPTGANESGTVQGASAAESGRPMTAHTSANGAETSPVECTAESGRFCEAIPLDAECQKALFDSCDQYGIPYHVALGLIETESRFDPYVVSYAGCYGLCQLNPLYFPSGLSPADNIRYGMEYLAERVRHYGGDIVRGLQGYTNYIDNGSRVYPNTVLAFAEKWKDVIGEYNEMF